MRFNCLLQLGPFEQTSVFENLGSREIEIFCVEDQDHTAPIPQIVRTVPIMELVNTSSKQAVVVYSLQLVSANNLHNSAISYADIDIGIKVPSCAL